MASARACGSLARTMQPQSDLAATPTVKLGYVGGTLEVRGLPDERAEAATAGLRWDKRSACHRCPAFHYADLVRYLVKERIAFVDEARRYGELSLAWHEKRNPRPYQVEALGAWLKERGRGTVVLPTGAGKTQVALMAIADRQRASL